MDTGIQVPQFRSASMPDHTRVTKTSTFRSSKRSFGWNGSRCDRRRLRFPFRIQQLEARFLLAGDVSPTIDPIPNLSVNEDADLQSIALSGISAGEGPPSSLRISASSQNELLVAHPAIVYQAGQPTGILELQPTPDAHGTATITVTVEDSGPDNDDTTITDNGVTTLNFTVNVASVNDPPTLTQPEPIAFTMNSEASTVASSPTVAGLDYGELHTGSTFTSSIDLTQDGTGMIVGASGGTDTNVGYVEVYQRADELSPWTQIGQQLMGDAQTALGRAVSLNDSSTRIAISTGREVSIREFDSELNTWVPLGAPIVQPGVIASLAMDSIGDLLAIATADSDGIPRAQLHRFDGNDWHLEQDNLTMGQDVSEDVKDQVLQSRVAMNAAGTRLIHSIAGCGCSGTGFAMVYEQNTETSQWSSVGDRIQGEGSYGSAAAISEDGQTITIGAPQLGTETDLFGNGLVEVLRFDTTVGQWLPHGNAIAGTDNGQQFGTAVALSQDASTLVVGSPGASTESANKGGKVSIFQFDDLTSEWQLIQEHDGPDPNGSFGWRVAISATGSSLITGARGSTSSPNKNGSLFSFSKAHSVYLTGITAGANEIQPVRITAFSENDTVTGQPTLTYVNNDTEADLLFRPNLDHAGMAVIKVTVEDAGLDGDFGTVADNGLTERTFSFGVGLSNFEEKSDLLSLELGEAGGDIRLSRTTDGTVLDIEGDRWTGQTTDKILLPEESRMVLPNLNDFGRVELLLEQERNLIFDDTTAWRLGTPLVDGQRFLRGLTSPGDSSEVIYIDGGAAWQNPIDPNDIDASGHVSPVDVLQIINELAARLFSDPQTGILSDPLTVETWPNRNFDQNASGHISPLDAIRVINTLTTQQSSQGGEGEFLPQLLPQSSYAVLHSSIYNDLHPDASHLHLHLTPSESKSNSDLQTPTTASLPSNVNNASDTFLESASAKKASASQPKTTIALLSTNNATTHAVDDVLENWH